MTLRPVVLALVAASLSACQTVTFVRDAENFAANVFIPLDQERQLGLQVGKEIEAKSKLLRDPEVVGYVTNLGRRVAVSSPNPDKWQFTFKVIDDAQTVNAFAIPGGTIYVYTGLLKSARDEAEVAGVIGHEIAHVTSRHVARRMVETYGLQAVAGVALGENPGVLEQMISGLLVQGTLLKNSRDDESEADHKGVAAVSRSGYDPRGLSDFFQVLKAAEGNVPAILSFLSDHPATEERIQAIQSDIVQKKLGGKERNPAALQAIQKRLP